MEKFLYNSNTGNYNFIMAYPATEEFAMASLGYLWLYKIADTKDGVNAIRYYTNSSEKLPQKIGAIAFSMSFDFDCFGVLEILEKLNIPFLAKDRTPEHPIIFAGGPVITTNPRPYEAFFDFMELGDGEETFSQILDILKSTEGKNNALDAISRLDGIYTSGKKYSARAIVNPINIIYTPILSDKSYFKNTFIIEISRGCMNRCAFCTACYTNLPFRANDYEEIIETIELGLKHTNKIALLGAQISAHPNFDDIMQYIYKKIQAGIQIELGISSLRTDSVTPEMVQTLVAGGQKHSTIAIEAASERLRKIINKNLKEEQILNAVKIARENGLKGLKIYSMIGLPSETNADIEEFLHLGNKIKNENKGFHIEFSFSSFVPKPQTPFQWAQRENTKSLEKKQRFLEKGFAKLGIASKFSSIKWDYWQSVLSLADETYTDFIIEVYRQGGKIGAYKNAAKKTGIILRDQFSTDSELPWDVINSNPRKELLLNEYFRLMKKTN